MANPDWGAKHSCQSCGAKYYDLNRSPIVCPKCGTAFNPDALLRSRRSRPAPQPKETAAAPATASLARPGGDEDEAPKAEDTELEEIKESDEDIAALAESDEDDDKLIEDTSDLGEDEDDVAEVVVGGDENEET